MGRYTPSREAVLKWVDHHLGHEVTVVCNRRATKLSPPCPPAHFDTPPVTGTVCGWALINPHWQVLVGYRDLALKHGNPADILETNTAIKDHRIEPGVLPFRPQAYGFFSRLEFLQACLKPVAHFPCGPGCPAHG